MKARTLAAIVKKDLLEVKQNTSVMMSIIIVPLVFVVVSALDFDHRCQQQCTGPG